MHCVETRQEARWGTACGGWLRPSVVGRLQTARYPPLAHGYSLRTALRPPQRCNRCARRPRQDDARRRDALAVRLVPREPGRERARHGLGRPGAREGDHDPRQEHLGAARRREDQHHRHARARGLRRRGGARPDDGRRHPAARRRLRRPAAADALRPAQGAREAPARRARRQQGRPAGCAGRGGRERGLRALPRPRRHRVADRVPDRLRRRPRRPRRSRARRARRQPGSALRDAARDDPAAVVRPRAPAAGAGHESRRVRVRRPPGAPARPARDAPQGPADRVVPRERHDRERARDGALHHAGARPRARRRSRPRRDRRAGRAAGGDDRRDDRRSRESAPAARDGGRRAEPLDHDRDQHVAARRHRGHAADREPGQGSVSTRSSSATSPCASCRRCARTRGRCRAAASCSSRCLPRSCAAKASS